VANTLNLERNFLLRADGSLWEDNAAAVAVRQIAADEVIPVAGRRSHAVQVSGIASSDAWSIQGTLDGTTWVTIKMTSSSSAGAVTSVTSDDIFQFTGLFLFLRAHKTAGTGTSKVWLMSGAL
jgi:hypothetical protein